MSGYPGSNADDTAYFPAWSTANDAAPINPNVNQNPDTSATNYTFAALTVDNTGSQGWTFVSNDGTSTSLNLLGVSVGGTVTGLTVVGNGNNNVTTFGNPFVVGAAQTWALGGNTAFTGGVNAQSNNLTLSLTNAPTVTFGSAITNPGTLSVIGSGTLVYPSSGQSPLALAGGISPGGGNATGTLNLNTTAAAVSNGFQFDIGSSGGSPLTDVLHVTGSLNVAGLNVTPNLLAGGTFDNTQSYTWVVATTDVNGGLTGVGSATVANPTGFPNLGGGTFTLTANQMATALVLTFTPAPEPGLLLGTAAAGFGLFNWVRRNRRRIS